MALTEQMNRQGNWLFKHRGILPLIIFIVGVFLYIKNESNPQNWILEGRRFEIYYELLCLIISLFGFLIRVYTVGYSPPNTSGRNTENQVADVLSTKGIYSIVRNPLYVGNFFMWLGIAMLTGNFWFIVAFTLFYFLYYERIIFTEEQYLKNKFGDTYDQWAKTTPVIIPKFSAFKKVNYGFNWKKVLRQEKNGLAALLIIFSLFDITGELIKDEPNYNEILQVAGIIGIIAYCILKFIKYKTTLLTDNPQ